MSKIKYFIVIVCFLLLCGCTSSYNLIIDDDSFREEININMENDIYRLYPFDENNIEFKQYPIYQDNSKLYDTKVIDNGNNKDILLSYSYKPSEFKNSNALNLCFDKFVYKYDEDFYEIDLYGEFKCLYNNEDLDIRIITDKKVISNNADIVNGNTYVWHINKDNKDQVSINIKISNKKSGFNYLLVGAIILGVIALGVYFVLVYRRNSANKDVV